MTELNLQAAVGARPAPNRLADVRTVQTLLKGLSTPLRHQVAVTGSMDEVTRRAIVEFQRRFMARPDGRLDPGGRTLFHLNNEGSPSYRGCTPAQRRKIDRDLIDAQSWLVVVNRRLRQSTNSEVRRVVLNVFHVDLSNATHVAPYFLLVRNFNRLRQSMDTPFPIQCEGRGGLFGAWVDLSDPTGTMHFPANHFASSHQSRVGRIIHERAHTVFQISHSGMVGAGSIDFGHNPDDDNGFTMAQAFANAYCYGWLATALQPGYRREMGGLTIEASP